MRRPAVLLSAFLGPRCLALGVVGLRWPVLALVSVVEVKVEINVQRRASLISNPVNSESRDLSYKLRFKAERSVFI